MDMQKSCSLELYQLLVAVRKDYEHAIADDIMHLQELGNMGIKCGVCMAISKKAEPLFTEKMARRFVLEFQALYCPDRAYRYRTPGGTFTNEERLEKALIPRLQWLNLIISNITEVDGKRDYSKTYAWF